MADIAALLDSVPPEMMREIDNEVTVLIPRNVHIKRSKPIPIPTKKVRYEMPSPYYENVVVHKIEGGKKLNKRIRDCLFGGAEKGFPKLKFTNTQGHPTHDFWYEDINSGIM